MVSLALEQPPRAAVDNIYRGVRPWYALLLILVPSTLHVGIYAALAVGRDGDDTANTQ